MNSKKTAITFAADGNYAIGVCTNIMSIEEKSPNLADKYIVFYDNWDETMMDKLSAFSDKVEFVEYTRDYFNKKNEKIFFNDKTIKQFLDRYSHFAVVFSEIFMLLERFEQVIFMDSDFIVLADISDFKEIDEVAWRGGMLTHNYKGNVLDRPNAGLLIFPKSIPYKQLSSKFIEYFAEVKSNELALTRMMYDFDIEVRKLGFENNFVKPFLENADIKKDIKIFHVVGKKKLWNNQFMRFLFPEYNRYYEYFSYKCSDDDDFPFSNRTEFINYQLRTDIWRKFLFNGEIDNKLVNLDISTIFKDELQYYYKDYDNIKFRVRYRQFDICRIYFHMTEEKTYKLSGYIMSRNDLTNKILPYNFYAYNDNSKVFYCDVEQRVLLKKFNRMINLFTRVVDEFFDNVDANDIKDTIQYSSDIEESI